MATPTYNVDYNDERFQTVEADKQTALNEINNTYNNMINQSEQFYQAQLDATQKYADKQQQLQQKQTDFAIEKIEQQREQAEKDYTKEQKGAYVDWQKQSNKYGVNAERMADSGLANTGYSEFSQVSMYNTYQNRVSTARESFQNASLNYDNAIKEAQLANSSAMAELAYNALQTQLEISLQGFQYKNDLLQTQIQQQQNTEDRYYSRWQDVLNQINSENQLAESVRQYEEQKQIEQDRWEREFALAQQESAQAQANWEREFALAKSSSSSGRASISKSNSSSISKNDTSNSAQTMAKDDYYFSNGYQPRYINNVKLSQSGLSVSDVFGNSSPVKGSQNIWKAGTKYFVWVGDGNKGGDYVDVTADVNKSEKNKVTVSW